MGSREKTIDELITKLFQDNQGMTVGYVKNLCLGNNFTIREITESLVRLSPKLRIHGFAFNGLGTIETLLSLRRE